MRDHAFIELLYSSGLRLSELVSLDWRYFAPEPGLTASSSWVDLDTGEATVLGKGGKTRTVPIGTHARSALARWLEHSFDPQGRPARTVSVRARPAPDRAQRAGAARSGRAPARARRPCASRTCCGIRLRRTCCSRAATCARFRNCSATRTSQRHRSIRGWTGSISPRPTTPLIRAQSGAVDAATIALTR